MQDTAGELVVANPLLQQQTGPNVLHGPVSIRTPTGKELGGPMKRTMRPENARVILASPKGQMRHISPPPPSSPDLNPIEPLRLLLKNCVAKIKGSSNSTEKLWEAAQEAWESITIKEVNMHTKNMPARVQAVLKAKGGHTAF
ncbi:hypothetical protein BN14_09699 [Rhizoctonia solani AG-1 IB]|uniref:Uncharacterized protein n=1 Tax=Thanatephorus cucumeris (strain AG1-IB / isolate 7/3/14) TaxID=1108050 RepID=M5C813_THACB|nr:hypothetical protein BN14_09699 [Rhizoctonia solani AG-1 IB]